MGHDLVLFVSIAASKRTELAQATCYDTIATAFEAAPPTLKEAWTRVVKLEAATVRDSSSSVRRKDIESANRLERNQGNAAGATKDVKAAADSAIAAAAAAAATAESAADAAAVASGKGQGASGSSTSRSDITSALELRSALAQLLIHGNVSTECFSRGLRWIYDEPLAAPTDQIQSLRAKANGLRAPKPIKDYGVELPDHATLSVLGTPLRMELLAFTQWLQFALAPVLVLWLGSLYHTRRRECYFIKRMRDVRQLFPHVVNIYPQGEMPPLRKRNRLAYFVRRSVPYFFFPLVRALILAFFIGAPIVTYLTSLVLMVPGDRPSLALVIFTLLVFLLIAIVLTEFMPGHIGKEFPLL